MSASVVYGVLAALVGASPRLVHAPESPRPGDLLWVRVTTTATAAEARLGDQRYPLVPAENGFAGFVAVPIEAEASVALAVRTPSETLRTEVAVTARSWKRTKLRVAKRFTRKGTVPPALKRRLTRERAAIQAVWDAAPSPLRRLARAVSPTRDPYRTGVYGTRREMNGVLKSRHYGLDLRGGVGDPVKAILPGRVVLSGMRYYSGGTLILDHGAGLYSLYFHLSRRAVKLGQRVRAGQRIGRVGRSGRVTGPHLHLSVGVRAEGPGGARVMYVDPEPVLEGKGLPRAARGSSAGAAGTR